MNFIHNMCLDITLPELLSHLPRASQLMAKDTMPEDILEPVASISATKKMTKFGPVHTGHENQSS